MKKVKKPGENFSLKTKKNESAAVMDWINSQSNLMDSIRFLIENEIRENGVRNLQQVIPSDRSMLPVGFFSAEQETAAAAAIEGPAGRGASAAAESTRSAPTVPVAPVAEEIDEEDIESWL